MFRFDNRILYIILGVLVLTSLASYLTDQNKLLSLLLTLPGVIIAITFHEFAHAFAADKLGDDTPRREGRLTLNPTAHLDPIGSVLLVFAHFGWGKPVQINPRNFNRNISMSAGEAIVSAAGPIMNLLLAIIFTIVWYAIARFAPVFLIGTQWGNIVSILLQMTIIVNIGLGIFNLIPLPPLDGSKILMHFAPQNVRIWLLNHENIFYIAFLIIWITGLAGLIISPVINGVGYVIESMVSWVFSLIP